MGLLSPSRSMGIHRSRIYLHRFLGILSHPPLIIYWGLSLSHLGFLVLNDLLIINIQCCIKLNLIQSLLKISSMRSERFMRERCIMETFESRTFLSDPILPSSLSISFIHSFIISHYPRVQLPAASHYVLVLSVHILFSLSPLSASFLSSILVRFLLYGSNRFVLLMNSTVCFIICGWPNNLSMFSLPFPMSLIIFFLCCLNLRHSNK